jgi:hypothetical protein
MSDNTNDQQQQGGAPSQALNSDTIGPVPYTRFKEQNEELKALKAELDALKAEEAGRRTKELAEQEKWRELAVELQSKLDAITPEAKRAADLEASLKATVIARVSRLPETVQTLVPEFDDPRSTLGWLDKNEPLLVRPTAPGLDAGPQGDARPTVTLTAGQKAAAKLAGISEEQYIKALLKSAPKE